MARWEFIKQTFGKVYFVYKDGIPVCKIRYGNAFVGGKIYKVIDEAGTEEVFTRIREAKEYIKANY